MRTLLICHGDAPLHYEGVARWLADGSTLTGILIIDEPSGAKYRRVRRELRRSGIRGFLDVMAFRLYYRVRHAKRDQAWLAETLAKLRKDHHQPPASIPTFHTQSPNNMASASFIRRCRPDLAIALCKVILKPAIFSIPADGTFVFHPGICPEYRNAHGCFWALVNRDLDHVGLTLLRIDEGVDTGPIYRYFTYPFDEVSESHVIIQHRVLFDNLDSIMGTLHDIHAGRLTPLETTGRASAVWGQPRLTRYLRWKRAAQRDAAHRR